MSGWFLKSTLDSGVGSDEKVGSLGAQWKNSGLLDVVDIHR